MPRVSVIITAHNYSRYLGTCLESVLRQSYRNHEVVVVDDGSTDATPGVLARYRHHPRIRTFRLPGVGLAASANYGIAQSRGEYVIRLDADDWFDEHLLLVEVTELDRHPRVGMVYPDVWETNETGEVRLLHQWMSPYQEDRMLDRNPLAAGALFRKACWAALGGYEESLRFQEDHDFWIRFVRRWPVKRIPLPLLYYRRHRGSMSTQGEPRRKARQAVRRRLAQGETCLGGILGIYLIPSSASLEHGEPSSSAPGLPMGEESLQPPPVTRWVGICARRGETPQPDFQRLVELLEDPALIQAFQTGDLEEGERRLRRLVCRFQGEHGRLPEACFLGWIGGRWGAAEIQEALDALCLWEADLVLGVEEIPTGLWRPGTWGLEPIQASRGGIRRDRDRVYRDTQEGYLWRMDWLLGHRSPPRKVVSIWMPQGDPPATRFEVVSLVGEERP